jgi:hypothetical protein
MILTLLSLGLMTVLFTGAYLEAVASRDRYQPASIVQAAGKVLWILATIAILKMWMN